MIGGQHRRGVNAFAALAACVIAVRIVLSAIVPGWGGGGPLGLDVGPATALEHVLAIEAGVALLLVARGLWRGTRRAALVATLAFATLGVIAVVHDQLVGSAIEFALVGVTLMIIRLLRPQTGAEGHSEAEHRRAAALVADYGVDSLDPFALRPDKAFHFAAGGFLAYRTVRGTAVISGDPIGPEGAAPAILESFAAEASRRGWSVAMTGAGPRHLAGYRALGFQTLCIGEEAVVDPAVFSLEGARMKSVRKAVGRQGRRGWQIEVVEGHDLEASTVAQLDAVDRRWRADQPRLTGFAMTLGRLWGAEEDTRSLYVTGRDPEGVIRAFVRFSVYRGGLSLDVMRRIGEPPNGLTESMVVAAIEYARERGLHAVSLNFAGFAHVMAADRALTRPQRLLRWLLTRSHGRFQLERLTAFNRKFLPAWQPRYLVHQGSLDLPLAGLRVLQAEAYVRAPRTPRLSARLEPAPLPVYATTPTPLPAP